MTDDLLPENERDAPIEVYFGNSTLDMGIATVPKILPRYWIYLASDGDRLNEREYALLMQVLLLRESQDFELRVSNIPAQCPVSTITRSLALLRRMGLVFTERIYYDPKPGKPPVLRAQRWDLRSLFFNLEVVAKTWQAGQRQAQLDWETGSRRGRKPIYAFPADFSHKVRLPVEVAVDVLRGVFFPRSEKWEKRARELLEAIQNDPANTSLPTAQILRDRQSTTQNLRGTPPPPTAQNMRGRQSTAQDLRGHLFKDDEDEEEDAATLVERVFAYFAERKGSSDYHPTVKEQVALEKLLADGFTYEQITAGIDAAFARPSRPKHFTHCAAIARDLARLQQESRTPEPRNQPEPREPEALEETDQPSAETPAAPVEVIETHLARAVEVYRSAGREITGDLLARFRLMAARCDQAARAVGATGGDWLTDALSGALGVARPGNLLNYADAVLSDWIANGRSEKPAKPAAKSKTPRRETPATNREPAAHAGIREYLEKHGGIPNGDRD